MDPLLLEALRFGLAILAGGLVAVIAQRLAFRDARMLEDRRRDQEGVGLRRALAREIDENLLSIGPVDGGRQAPGSIQRGAWNAARSLAFRDGVFDTVARAYSIGSDLNSRIAMVERNLTARGGALDFTTNEGRQADAHQKALVDQVNITAKAARAAFEAARDALKR